MAAADNVVRAGNGACLFCPPPPLPPQEAEVPNLPGVRVVRQGPLGGYTDAVREAIAGTGRALEEAGEAAVGCAVPRAKCLRLPPARGRARHWAPAAVESSRPTVRPLQARPRWGHSSCTYWTGRRQVAARPRRRRWWSSWQRLSRASRWVDSQVLAT